MSRILDRDPSYTRPDSMSDTSQHNKHQTMLIYTMSSSIGNRDVYMDCQPGTQDHGHRRGKGDVDMLSFHIAVN